MCRILITECFAYKPLIGKLVTYLNPTGLEINTKMPRLSEQSQFPPCSIHKNQNVFSSLLFEVSLFLLCVFPGCIHSQGLVYRAPRCSKTDSCVIQEYRKWALTISKPTAFGSNNLICIITHSLHMQKASQRNKAMDLVVVNGLSYQFCFMKFPVYLQ